MTGWLTRTCTPQAIYKANTIVDWLEGKSLEEIAESPRRCLRVLGDDIPPALIPYVGEDWTSSLDVCESEQRD